MFSHLSLLCVLSLSMTSLLFSVEAKNSEIKGSVIKTIVHQQGASGVSLYQSYDWVVDGTFTQGVEGPAVDQNGVLYAVNYQQEGTVGAVHGKNNVKLILKLKNGSIGNGIRFDKQGNMYIADYVNHNILKVAFADLNDYQKTAPEVIVHAHSPLMNQPNDIAIASNGTIFASDPNWGENNGQLWRISSDGDVKLLEKNMGTTNGVEVSPNNKILYVNESVQRNIWRYDLTSQGEIKNKKLLIHFDDFGLDGMRTDKQGNLYIARYGKGVVAIVSPQGKLLREIKLKGSYPTNVAFGGKQGNQVFVTMQKRGAIETFLSEYAGRSFTE
ncbi:MAG: SMP-30/gluconolactonase/LRE family protein [Colwellia sp.]